MSIEFQLFPKIARLNRECVITEKIDGTNAQVHVSEDGTVRAGSRTRWITPGKNTDNYGFAAWVADHADELRNLGPGHHFGEWWGSGIQRGYGLTNGERRFSLFDVNRWCNGITVRPSCCEVVRTLYHGPFSTQIVTDCVDLLRRNGSFSTPHLYMKPEGVIVWHKAARLLFKVTLENDDEPKSHVYASDRSELGE